MPMSERLRALYLAREGLEHAHTALLTDSASELMRRWARRLALMIEQVEREIVAEETKMNEENRS